jgi:hypothetical protein
MAMRTIVIAECRIQAGFSTAPIGPAIGLARAPV